MITAADQDIVVLPHGEFCRVAAADGGAKEVSFRDDAGTTELCALADECFTWARSDGLMTVNPGLYYRCWRLLAKSRLAALRRREQVGQPVSVSVAITHEGDQLVACVTLDVVG